MKKVLVVDDDLAVLEVLEETLKYGEFSVKAVSVTADIFAEIEQSNPDVILLDYLLRGLNGGELCRLVKENPSTGHIPVIITSAYPKAYIGSNYRYDDFIPKPFDLDDLLSVIRRHAGNAKNPQLSS